MLAKSKKKALFEFGVFNIINIALGKCKIRSSIPWPLIVFRHLNGPEGGGTARPGIFSTDVMLIPQCST